MQCQPEEQYAAMRREVGHSELPDLSVLCGNERGPAHDSDRSAGISTTFALMRGSGAWMVFVINVVYMTCGMRSL